MRFRILAHPILLAFCLVAVTSSPTVADWKDGKFGDLFQYVGTTSSKRVRDDPRVRRATEELLGDNIPHLMQNLEQSGNIDAEGPYLVIWGQKPHEGHLERGILVIDAYNGKVHAGIFSNGKTTIYSTMDKETTEFFEPEKHFSLLPEALRRFARFEEIYELTKHEPKTNFRWVK